MCLPHTVNVKQYEGSATCEDSSVLTFAILIRFLPLHGI